MTATTPSLSAYQFLGLKDFMEWDELASLAHSLGQRPQALVHSPAGDFNAAWNVTLPAALSAAPESTPFREAMQGLVMREVSEPEVFRHFFG